MRPSARPFVCGPEAPRQAGARPHQRVCAPLPPPCTDFVSSSPPCDFWPGWQRALGDRGGRTGPILPQHQPRASSWLPPLPSSIPWLGAPGKLPQNCSPCDTKSDVLHQKKKRFLTLKKQLLKKLSSSPPSNFSPPKSSFSSPKSHLTPCQNVAYHPKEITSLKNTSPPS